MAEVAEVLAPGAVPLMSEEAVRTSVVVLRTSVVALRTSVVVLRTWAAVEGRGSAGVHASRRMSAVACTSVAHRMPGASLRRGPCRA